MKAFCLGFSWVALVRWQARIQCNRQTQVDEIVMGRQLVARCKSGISLV